MELRVLKYFLAVASEKSITAAARKLHVTQPTLSKQIMELEAELGKKLFIRGGRNVSLTDEGKLLMIRAQEIVTIADKTVREFQNTDAASVTGDIYIGGGETRGMAIIAEAIKKVTEKYPEIRFHLYSADGDMTEQLLERGVLDFALFIGYSNMNKFDSLEIGWSDEYGAVVKSDSELAKLDRITAKDLEDTPFMCSYRESVQNSLSGWLGKNVKEFRMIGTYNLIGHAAIFVEQGVCAALTLKGITNTDRKTLKYIPFEPRMTAKNVLMWNKNKPFSKAAEIFLETFKQVNSEWKKDNKEN